MRILYIVPGDGLTDTELERRRGVLQEYAFEGTTVDFLKCENGVKSIESYYDDTKAAPAVMDAVIKAEKDGYDGVIIGCAGDPGLYGAREMVKIPVVGPGENAVHLATMLGTAFSVIAIVDNCVPRHKQLVLRSGISLDRLASVRAANISVLDVAKDPDVTKKRVAEEARLAVEQDGANCIILGCLSLAFSLFDRELSDMLGIPVINPALSALKTLESMISLGISHSKLGYRIPLKYR